MSLPSSFDFSAIKLVSFDVFDTVLARDCGAPEAIFRIVGGKVLAAGILDIPQRAFEQQRVAAERRVRQHRGRGEISLSDIYCELNRLWWLPAEQLQVVLECELATERENLFAIPVAAQLVAGARNAGKQVIFVSDMYLPAAFVRSVLQALGTFHESDRLYVSSEWNATKADGSLFRLVAERERVAGGEVLHLGDSHPVDVVSARRQGWRSAHLVKGSLNGFEVTLAKGESEHREGAGTLAGVARRVRLARAAEGRCAVAAGWGASLAGPVLVAFAEWLLRGAKASGLRRLYFLARDGEALLRVCEVMAPALKADDLELRYLYGSRETWSPLILERGGSAAADFFASHVAFTAGNWRECVTCLGLSPEAVDGTGLIEAWDEVRDSGELRKRVYRDLISHPSLGGIVVDGLRLKSAQARRYLREQGLGDSVASGLVDCGWSGTWTDLIGDAIAEQGGLRPTVWFIGRRKRLVPSRCETRAWMFDLHAGGGLPQVPDFLHVVIEFLLTADHGRTTAFKESGGRLEPVLAPVDWQGFDPESWRTYRGALLDFVVQYAKARRGERIPVDLRPVLAELITLFWERPARNQAEFFSGHTIGLSPTGKIEAGMARPYRMADIGRLLVTGRLPGVPPFWWHEGALTLSSPPLRLIMGSLWVLRELLRSGSGEFRRHPGFGSLARSASAAARAWKRSVLTPIPAEEGGGSGFANGSSRPAIEVAETPPDAFAGRPVCVGAGLTRPE